MVGPPGNLRGHLHAEPMGADPEEGSWKRGATLKGDSEEDRFRKCRSLAQGHIWRPCDCREKLLVTATLWLACPMLCYQGHSGPCSHGCVGVRSLV